MRPSEKRRKGLGVGGLGGRGVEGVGAEAGQSQVKV